MAEEQCFLTDKGKASRRQDVWAWLGPALKSQSEGREPAVQLAGGNAAVLISILRTRLYLPDIFQLCRPGLCSRPQTHRSKHANATNDVLALNSDSNRQQTYPKMTFLSTHEAVRCDVTSPHTPPAYVIKLTRVTTFIMHLCLQQQGNFVLVSTGLDHYPLRLQGFRTQWGGLF